MQRQPAATSFGMMPRYRYDQVGLAVHEEPDRGAAPALIEGVNAEAAPFEVVGSERAAAQTAEAFDREQGNGRQADAN